MRVKRVLSPASMVAFFLSWFIYINLNIYNNIYYLIISSYYDNK